MTKPEGTVSEMSVRRGTGPAARPGAGQHTDAIHECGCGQEIDPDHREHCSRCGVLLAGHRAA